MNYNSILLAVLFFVLTLIAASLGGCQDAADRAIGTSEQSKFSPNTK